MMKLKTSQLLVSNCQHKRVHISDYLKAQQKHGILKMDLVGHAPHLWLDHIQQPDTGELTRLLKQNNIEVEVVTPLSYKYSLSSKKGSRQSEATYAYYCNCIKAASALGGGIVVVPIEGGCFDVDPSEQWKYAVEQLKRLSLEAEKQSVKLALLSSYNELSPIVTTLQEVAQMIDDVASDSLNAVLDTQRISVAGESITQWFETLGKRIVLIRLTDGNYNGVRVWGEGSLPCRRFLDEIESCDYSGPISLQFAADQYAEDPISAFESNLTYVRSQMTGGA